MRSTWRLIAIVWAASAIFTPAVEANALDCTAILRDGKQVETHISVGETELLFKLEIEVPTQIKLESSFSISPFNYAHFQLENEKGEIYDLGDVHTGSYTLSVNPICLPAGDYYVRVSFESNTYPNSWLYIGYSTIPDTGWGDLYYYEFEDNNTLSTANSALNTSNLYGAVLNYQECDRGLGHTDIDYYQVNLSSTSNVVIDYWAVPDVELALLDSKGNQVRVNASPNNKPCILKIDGERGVTGLASFNCGVLPEGNYYIRVSGQHTSAESTSYRIGWYPVESMFSDVNNETPHALNINWLYAEGISTGWETAQGLEYRPLAEVVRCDMAAFLYRLAGSPSFEPSPSDWSLFSDVNKSTPHAREILWLASSGVTTGYPDHTFKPFATVARCDMAAFLHRMAGDLPSAGTVTFSDVSNTTPHAEDILWLAHEGVSSGFPDGTFKPYGTVVRCDMAAFLNRMQDKVRL